MLNMGAPDLEELHGFSHVIGDQRARVTVPKAPVIAGRNARQLSTVGATVIIAIRILLPLLDRVRYAGHTIMSNPKFDKVLLGPCARLSRVLRPVRIST